MSSAYLLQLFLVLHLIGFTIMAGTVVADYSIQRRLRKVLTADKQKALTILDGSAGFPALIGFGVLLIIGAGAGMVVLLKGGVVSMLWFKIKMILVLIVLLNGAVFFKKRWRKIKRAAAKKYPGEQCSNPGTEEQDDGFPHPAINPVHHHICPECFPVLALL